jgi:hypothetical protein
MTAPIEKLEREVRRLMSLLDAIKHGDRKARRVDIDECRIREHTRSAHVRTIWVKPRKGV